MSGTTRLAELIGGYEQRAIEAEGQAAHYARELEEMRADRNHWREEAKWRHQAEQSAAELRRILTVLVDECMPDNVDDYPRMAKAWREALRVVGERSLP